LSCSPHPNLARAFANRARAAGNHAVLFEIVTLGGGISTDVTSVYKGEQEVLLPPLTCARVDSIESGPNGFPVVHLTDVACI
jgi:hypothetical protein